jgi:hypothetical protein
VRFVASAAVGLRLPLVDRRGHDGAMAAIGVNQPCLTLLAATDRDLLSLLDAHIVRVTDSPPSRGKQGAALPLSCEAVA